MKKIICVISILILPIVLWISLSSAALLFDQSSLKEGTTNISRPSSLFTDGKWYWCADDFELAQESSISSYYWVGDASNSDSNDNVVGFYLKIYPDFYDIELGHYRPADHPIYEEYFSMNDVTESDIGVSGWSGYLATSSSAFTADPNTTYWLRIQADINNGYQPPYPDYIWGWHFSDTSNGNSGEYNSKFCNHLAVNNDYAFSLYGSPVPIPAAAWLLGSGLIGLVAFGGRRRRY